MSYSHPGHLYFILKRFNPSADWRRHSQVSPTFLSFMIQQTMVPAMVNCDQSFTTTHNTKTTIVTSTHPSVVQLNMRLDFTQISHAALCSSIPHSKDSLPDSCESTSQIELFWHIFSGSKSTMQSVQTNGGGISLLAEYSDVCILNYVGNIYTQLCDQ